MAFDYSESRHVPRNRPKRQSASIFVFLICGGLLTAFMLGMFAGWMLGRGKANKMTAAAQLSVVDSAQQKSNNQPGGVTAGRNVGIEGNSQTPVLTFYETLSKGNKSVLGTGLNPHKPENFAMPTAPPNSTAQAPPMVQVNRAATPQPLSPPATIVSGQKKSDSARAPTVVNTPVKETVKQAVDAENNTVASGKGKFTVQIASYRERKEAEAVRRKYAEKGITAYIAEHTDSDKAIWYRLRVGKRLELREANDLAAKSGKGALVIPE